MPKEERSNRWCFVNGSASAVMLVDGFLELVAPKLGPATVEARKRSRRTAFGGSCLTEAAIPDVGPNRGRVLPKERES
jgi:hypothetical protein